MRLPLCLFISFLVICHAAWSSDSRAFGNGVEIPDESYCDQPYIVITKDGNWLCTMTTGVGSESTPGQHAVATISTDQGKTWSKLIDIEPPDGPVSSWVTPLVTPSGRVYVFYNYNGDNVSELNGEKAPTVALLGWYVYKYSDDNGRTWSKERYRLPLPVAKVDRENDWKGTVQMFWGIDKPLVVNGKVVFAFTRMGRYLPKFPRPTTDDPADTTWRKEATSEKGEGWLYSSDNLLTESDPNKINWQLLPEGEQGIRLDQYDPIQQEHNIVNLPNNDLAMFYRTANGYIVDTYSRDGGKTWSSPEPVTYQANGAKLKNSIACPPVWRTADGRYLLWYHNNDDMRRGNVPDVTSRNIAWLAAGIENKGKLKWSQPELVIYNGHPRRGLSYPDLVESAGQYFLSPTDKKEARLVQVDKTLIEGLFKQGENKEVCQNGLLLDLKKVEKGRAEMPNLPNLAEGGGFTLDFLFHARDFTPGQVLLDSRDESGKGIWVTTEKNHTLQFNMNDGTRSASWQCDPEVLTTEKPHHVAFIVDGGPKMISAIIDGIFCDGGKDPRRPYGWGRFLAEPAAEGDARREITTVTGGPTLSIAPSFKGEIDTIRLYSRPLRTSEIIGNHQAGTGSLAASAGANSN